MTGWLVVNGFLRSAKFEEIYALIVTAFESKGISISVKTNDILLAVLNRPMDDKPDFVLFWDKDVALARHLENEGLRLFNPARGIELCDDKGWTALALEGSGVPIPKTILAPLKFGNDEYPSYDFLDSVIAELGFPLIVKERKGSFGREVRLVESRSELLGILRKTSAVESVFQEFIASSFGRDVRLQTLGDSVAASVTRRGAPGDFRSNVTAGGYMTPFDPPQSFIDAALAAAKRLGLDFAGVDLLFGPDGEPILCEVNSNPHFKNLFDATGLNFAEALADYVIGAIW